MKDKILSLCLLAFLVGCASAPKSEFRELKSLPGNFEPVSVWNICREGALADTYSLRVYLNDGYVANVDAGALSGKARIQVIGQHSSETLRIDAFRDNKQRTVYRLTRRPENPREIYLLIESETTRAIPVPLPGFLALGMQGKRVIRPVKGDEFDQFCSDASYKIYSR